MASAHRCDGANSPEDHGEAEEEGVTPLVRLSLEEAVVEVEADLSLWHVINASLSLQRCCGLNTAHWNHATPLKGVIIVVKVSLK